MTMSMAVHAVPPRLPPVTSQKQPVSPHEKQRPSLSLMPTTPRSSSRLAISNLNNTPNNLGFTADKNTLCQSFSELNSRSRSPTLRSEGDRRSLQTPSRRLHKSNDDDDTSGKPRGTSLMISPRRPSKQRDPLGASPCHSQSPRKISGLAAALHKPSPRKGDSMSLIGVSGDTSRSMPASLSPRKSSRTSGRSDTIRSPITPRLQGRWEFLQTEPMGVSESTLAPITPTRLRGGAHSPVKTRKSPPKLLQMDPLGVSESTPAPITPRRLRVAAYSPAKTRKSPLKFLQMDPLGVSESTPARIALTRLRRPSGGHSPVKYPTLPRKSLQMDPLGVSESTPARIAPTRLRRPSGGHSPVKSPTMPRKFLHEDPLGVSESTPAPIAPTRLRRPSGAYSPVKSPTLPLKFLHEDPLGVSESIRALQLHGTTRRSTGKGYTGRISAIPEQILFSNHHLEALHDRSGFSDPSSKTFSPTSFQGARPRAQRQTFRRTLSNHEMFSNRDMLVFKLNL
jgi:hypothetical protein